MGRSPCCEKAHTNKGAWTKEEDQRLIAYIRAHGEGCWRSLPKAAGLLRCGKSCRLRWINYLRPDLKRGNFTEEEDELIIKLHSLLGNKWSLIAGRLPGRTDNEIKNYWNTHIKRKLLSRGVDPHTHRPLHEPYPENSESPRQASIGHIPQQSTSNSDKNVGGDRQRELAEEGHSSSGASEGEIPDLNLDLSISLPFPSMPSPTTIAGTTEEGTSGAALSEQQMGSVVCLCCHLSLQSSTDCRCRTLHSSQPVWFLSRPS
ncbi:hypothetical protein AMTRI_Chr11g153790 [Amborella trichopoda]|uniref:Uncharacterized protein n=1 Tax=Amborella trichopoda TaxID=13333 RepID=W1NDS7_AMBTC|nr:myb-related protein 308 [Amborella trichopoda]ERM93882.1 hypothetical protein AMTR_s00139p00079430 [Amborella trichopoda]|eukprot:XP_006826645.1 myb-related protein 308 [Amborella trichopoda]